MPGTATSMFVLVAGPPGSGKTTLAAQLASAVGLPLIGKDAIKEALSSGTMSCCGRSASGS